MAIPADLQASLAKARTDRSRRQSQINRFLRFADPSKPRIGDSLTSPTERADEVDDLFDTTLQEVYEDFSSELIGRLMPRHSDWLTYAPVESLPQEDKKRIEEPLKARSTLIFEAIRASNFYDEAAGEWAMDQGHGTSGLMIVDPGKGQPIFCESIPPNQLLVGRGARGVDFKAREAAWQLHEAMAYWPRYNWTKKQRADAEHKTRRLRIVTVIEAASLIPTPAGERWKWRVVVDNEVVHETELRGTGCCPVITSRWRTHASSAWGVGPLLKCVPDALTLDQERYLVLKNLGKVVDPPTMYDDDGVLNPEGGVGAGMWIPRLPGSKIDTVDSGRIEAAFYVEGGLQDSIRRAGFQSGPRQRGKTPPTLGQWMDEKAEEGRRLEMPTGKLYSEGVIAIVQRFEYLLLKRGEIEPFLEIEDRKAPIKVQPLNPLSRQQDFEEIQTAQQLLQFGNAVFGPQIMAAYVDGAQTLDEMRKRLNDKLIVVREAADIDPLLRGVLGQPGSAAGLETPPEGA